MASARSDTWLLTSSSQCRDTIVRHGTTPGLKVALLENTKEGAFTMTREVVEYSEKPLDRGLFVPPGGAGTISLKETWTQRVESDWQQVERAFESWFQ
jgi:hypothetical protein